MHFKVFQRFLHLKMVSSFSSLNFPPPLIVRHFAVAVLGGGALYLGENSRTLRGGLYIGGGVGVFNKRK